MVDEVDEVYQVVLVGHKVVHEVEEFYQVLVALLGGGRG